MDGLMNKDVINVVDYKHELDKLTGNILNEYMKLESMYLQEKNNSTKSLTDINSKNSSICEALQTKTDQIYGLEKEIEGHKSKEQEYIHVINNLRKDLDKMKEQSNESPKETETETETNKFDIIRSQAKEISAKDKEIIRLTKELCKVKEMNEVKNGLSMVVKEDAKEIVSGWSPTSSDIPKQEVPSLKLDNDDEEDMFEIFYRKKKYYRDKENKVYEIKEDDEVGPCIGNWVKQDNGKFKVVKK
jgi:hypothetical protein